MSPFKYDMKRNWKKHSPLVKGLLITLWTIVGIAFAVGIAFLLGYIVMLLWNKVLAEAVSGIHQVNYFQAVGLVILAKILFGSMGGGHGKEKSKKRGPWGKRPHFRPGMHKQFQDEEGSDCEDWDMDGFWDTVGREAWKEWIRDEKKKRDKAIDTEGKTETPSS